MSKHTYTLIGGYASNSSSPSDIWEMQRDDGVICIAKLFIQSAKGIVPESAQLFNHEGHIYSEISKQNSSFNFMNSVFFVEFSDFLSGLTIDDLVKTVSQIKTVKKELLLRNLSENINFMLTDPSTYPRRNAINNNEKEPQLTAKYVNDKLKQYKADKMKFGAIVTVKTERYTLYEYEDKDMDDDPQKMDILPILLYATACLSAIGFNQNDMHWANVLVSRNAVDVPYYIVFENLCFRITNPDVPQLFDYDRGVEKGKHFEVLEDYEYSGYCPDYHPYRDILKGLCLLRYMLQSEIGDLYLEYIGDEDLKQRMKVDPDCFLREDNDGDESYFCKKVLDTVKGPQVVRWFLAKYHTWFDFDLVTENHKWMVELKDEINRNNGMETSKVKRMLFAEKFSYLPGEKAIAERINNIAKKLFV